MPTAIIEAAGGKNVMEAVDTSWERLPGKRGRY